MIFQTLVMNAGSVPHLREGPMYSHLRNFEFQSLGNNIFSVLEQYKMFFVGIVLASKQHTLLTLFFKKTEMNIT